MTHPALWALAIVGCCIAIEALTFWGLVKAGEEMFP